MDRLTERNELPGFLPVLLRGRALGPAYFREERDYKDYADALERLAQYEDTGLDPDEVKRVQETLVTAQRLKKEQYDILKKYLKAEAEGMLVWLPVKIGTPCFRIYPCRCSYVYREIKGCRVKDAEIVRVIEGKNKTYYCKKICNSNFELKDIANLGKTVFFSKEEAEKRIKQEAEL